MNKQTTASIQPTRHALEARAAKRDHAISLGIDREFISDMVEHFYARIRGDDLLAPIFAERIDDWPHHLERMKNFWRSVLHNSGEFTGNPMLKHIVIPGLNSAHFVRWLELFYATLNELLENREGIDLVAARARSIAESLLNAIAMQDEEISALKAGKELPHV